MCFVILGRHDPRMREEISFMTSRTSDRRGRQRDRNEDKRLSLRESMDSGTGWREPILSMAESPSILVFQVRMKQRECVSGKLPIEDWTMSSWDLLPLLPDRKQIVIGLRVEERGSLGWSWISVSGLLSLVRMSTSADQTLDAKLTPGILGVQGCNRYVLCRMRQAPTSSSVLS